MFGASDIDWGAVIRRACKQVEPASKPKSSIVDPVAKALPDVFARMQVNTIARQAHFISQSIHECQYYQTLTELASGDAYDQRTDMGFTAAKDGDGRLHKGFGIFQTTGPNNQRRALEQLVLLGFNITPDINKAREILTNPLYAAWVAGIYWRDNKLNAVADRDKTGKLMSRAINRGNANSSRPAYHEAERMKGFRIVFTILQNPPLLQRPPGRQVAGVVESRFPLAGIGEGVQLPTPGVAPARQAEPLELRENWHDDAAIAREDATAGADVQADRIVTDPHGALDLEPGTDSPPVPLPAEPVAPGVPEGLLKAGQARLAELGFYQVGMANGEAGQRTVGALASFQHVAGLPVTGQLDAATMGALWSEDAPHATVAPERALATADDVRASGSKIIAATDKVQTASLWQMIAGGVGTVGTVVVSGFSSAVDSLAPVRQLLDIPGWVWALLVCLILGGPALIAYIQAKRAQRERVEAFKSGKIT